MKSQRLVHADGAVTATGGGAFVTMSAAKAGVPISAAMAMKILTFIIGSLPQSRPVIAHINSTPP